MDIPANDEHLLIALRGTLQVYLAPLGFDHTLISLNVYTVVLLDDLEFG